MLKKTDDEGSGGGQSAGSTSGKHNPEAFAVNLARTIEQIGHAASAYLKPREEGKLSLDFSDTLTEVIKTLSRVVDYWTAEPERALDAQTGLFWGYFDIGTASMRRMMGMQAPPAAEPDTRDKRFSDPEWSDNAFFAFLKQIYLVTSRWAENLV